jgi:23S rRNA pseudouridine1911/1915/1917 synthase
LPANWSRSLCGVKLRDCQADDLAVRIVRRELSHARSRKSAPPMTHTFEVTGADASCALIHWLSARFPAIPHARLRSWILDGAVLVDGKPYKATRYIQSGQQIVVTPHALQPHPATPQALPLPIRYCDEHCIVVAKPAGMATHPGPGWWMGSCVNALLHAITDWPGINGVAGPGVVHRLDRDTSGLLVFARSDAAHQRLLHAAANRQFERVYLAWVEGTVKQGGCINAPLARDAQHPQRMRVHADGKTAITHFEVLGHAEGNTLLRLRLESGRNHQIRVHLAHIGHPVRGDRWYGTPGPHLALHAWQLGFTHPITHAPLVFEEPVPDTWQRT